MDNLFRIFRVPCTENSGSSVLNKGRKETLISCQEIETSWSLTKRVCFAANKQFPHLKQLLFICERNSSEGNGLCGVAPLWESALVNVGTDSRSNLHTDQKTHTVPGVRAPQMVPNQVLLFSLSTWKLLTLQMLISYCTKIN